MRTKKTNYVFNWMLIFGLIIGTELLDLMFSFHFPSIKIIRFASILILIGLLPSIIRMLKELGKNNEELRQSKLKLKNIFDTLDLAIWSHDIESDKLLITPGIEKLYGYSSTDFYLDLNLWKKVIYPDDLAVIKEREQKFAIGEAVTSEYRIIRPDGEVRWIQDRGIPTLDSKGNFIDFSSVLFDITDLKESEERYRSLVEMSPDIIAVVGSKKVEYMNEAGWRLVGASSAEEVIGKSPLLFAPIEIVKTIRNKLSGFESPEQARERFEFLVKRFDGETIDVEMAATPIFYEGRFAIQIVGRDITERKRAEKTIQNMAYYDSLTGLPNRNRFKHHLNNVLTQKENNMLAVLFLDLDRFKIINDTKGHSVGDIIL